MKHLTKSEVAEVFRSINKGAVYQKQGEFLARPAIEGETIITMIEGRIETIKEAKNNEIVLKNMVIGTSSEEYIITVDKYKKRYENTKELVIVGGQPWRKSLAKGKIEGGFYIGENVTFDAPWGEKMLLQDEDFLGRPYPTKDVSDIYRVALPEFRATYGHDPVEYAEDCLVVLK